MDPDTVDEKHVFRRLSEWIDGTTAQSATKDNERKTVETSTGFATNLYQLSLELFTLLLPLLLSSQAQPDDARWAKSFKRSLGRLFLWGDGVRSGKLEKLLDESEDLKELLIESLAAVGDNLVSRLLPQYIKYETPTGGEKIRQVASELEILIQKARAMTGSDDEDDEASINGDADTEDNSPVAIAKALETYTGCLMELLPSMEETLDSLEYQQPQDTSKKPTDFQVSGPAQPYVLKVLDKFSTAEIRLIQRLGEANWQRHTSLRRMMNEDEDEEEAVVQEVPKILFTAVSLFRDSGLGSSLPAQSTFAATVASHSSFQTIIADKNDGDLQVPPTPKEVSRGVPFICHICGNLLVRIRNRVDWKRHVFGDLKPYLCTFSGCKEEMKTFPTRTLWEEHEFSQHRANKHWSCFAACSDKSSSPEEWRKHLESSHKLLLSDDQFQISASLAEVSEPQPIETQKCPLCLVVPGKSRRHFATHVGKHMEVIALAALPREDVLDEQFASDSDLSHASASIPQISENAFDGSPAEDRALWSKREARTGYTLRKAVLEDKEVVSESIEPQKEHDRFEAEEQTFTPRLLPEQYPDFLDIETPKELEEFEARQRSFTPHLLTDTFQYPGSFGADIDYSGPYENDSTRNLHRLQLQNQLAATRPLMARDDDEKPMSRENSLLRPQSKIATSKPSYHRPRPKHDRVYCNKCDTHHEGFRGEHELRRHMDREHKTMKVAISKPTYQRPNHDRVRCTQCDAYPEGFRGEHELRRHMDREHTTKIKKWIIVESIIDGHTEPEIPLSKCKACSQQVKHYGFYYNAAAHLRRAHFNPKSKKKKPPEESRGGARGGDWPPMAELRNWMKEVEVEVEAGARWYHRSDHQVQINDESEDDVPDIVDYGTHDHVGLTSGYDWGGSTNSVQPNSISGDVFQANDDNVRLSEYDWGGSMNSMQPTTISDEFRPTSSSTDPLGTFASIDALSDRDGGLFSQSEEFPQY